MIQKATSMSNCWLAASCQMWHHDNEPAHASCLVQLCGETSTRPGYSVPLKPRYGALWLLVFPQTKITFEREEISNCQWDSGKYGGAADGDWENCVRSQGAYLEGDWSFIVLCTIFLVSCIFFNKCLFFILLAGYFLDRLCILDLRLGMI